MYINSNFVFVLPMKNRKNNKIWYFSKIEWIFITTLAAQTAQKQNPVASEAS